ncbi:hypothetical protein QAD02_022642 [Eretmocerus hayati]|uniref:Uncharacterized protein n=1 Tax=Eretmocerus hayati TaxID=131215 RepID=A0ACC2PV74_9HYME|nr:hypothetical protein QAD02_022642 [Eretmocerus hayati]
MDETGLVMALLNRTARPIRPRTGGNNESGVHSAEEQQGREKTTDRSRSCSPYPAEFKNIPRPDDFIEAVSVWQLTSQVRRARRASRERSASREPLTSDSGLSDEHSSRDTPESPRRKQRELRILIPRVDEVDSGVNSPRTPQSASTSPAPDTPAPPRHLGTIPRTAGISRRSRDRSRRPRPEPIGEEAQTQGCSTSNHTQFDLDATNRRDPGPRTGGNNESGVHSVSPEKTMDETGLAMALLNRTAPPVRPRTGGNNESGVHSVNPEKTLDETGLAMALLNRTAPPIRPRTGGNNESGVHSAEEQEGREKTTDRSRSCSPYPAEFKDIPRPDDFIEAVSVWQLTSQVRRARRASRERSASREPLPSDSGLSDEHSSRDTPESPRRKQRELRILIPRVDEVDSGVNSPRTPQSASTSPAPDTPAPPRHLGTIPRTAGISRRSRDRSRRPRPEPIGEEAQTQGCSTSNHTPLAAVTEVPEPSETPNEESEVTETNAGLDPVGDSDLAQRELEEFLGQPDAVSTSSVERAPSPGQSELPAGPANPRSTTPPRPRLSLQQRLAVPARREDPASGFTAEDFREPAILLAPKNLPAAVQQRMEQEAELQLWNNWKKGDT